jgi:flagellar biosynthesis chaperone FliJ
MRIYSQVKVSVDPALAASFKTACILAGVSMASEFSKFMEVQTGLLSELSFKRLKKSSIETRGRRRLQVGLIIAQLESVKAKEEAYKDNIPENLQSGQTYVNAQQSVQTLEQAIELLEEAY